MSLNALISLIEPFYFFIDIDNLQAQMSACLDQLDELSFQLSYLDKVVYPRPRLNGLTEDNNTICFPKIEAYSDQLTQNSASESSRAELPSSLLASNYSMYPSQRRKRAKPYSYKRYPLFFEKGQNVLSTRNYYFEISHFSLFKLSDIVKQKVLLFYLDRELLLTGFLREKFTRDFPLDIVHTIKGYLYTYVQDEKRIEGRRKDQEKYIPLGQRKYCVTLKCLDLWLIKILWLASVILTPVFAYSFSKKMKAHKDYHTEMILCIAFGCLLCYLSYVIFFAVCRNVLNLRTIFRRESDAYHKSKDDDEMEVYVVQV